MALPSATVKLVKRDSEIILNTTLLREAISNKIIKVEIMQAGSTKQDSVAPTTKYKDTKKLTYLYNFEGEIRAQTTTIKGVSNKLTAAQAKNAFINYIVYGAGEVFLYWNGLAKEDSNYSTALASLMESSDADRKTEVVVILCEFSDIGRSTAYTEYTIAKGYDYNEWGPKKYTVKMKFTKGKVF